MKTLFGHEIRILMCQNCAAPLDAPLSSGRIRCNYCSQVNQVTARDERADLAVAQQPVAMSEAERIARLRDQDVGRRPIPASLMHLVAGDAIDPLLQKQALNLWLSLRARLANAPFSDHEQLHHLTLLLAPTLEDRHRRALLENAVEVLADIGHRQVIRCALAEEAIFAGDLRAADEWLSLCSPHSTMLQADSAYRLASAFLAVARRDPDGVSRQLGHQEGDVPIADERDDEAVVLRAHALEMRGRTEEAWQQLYRAMCADVRRIHGVDLTLGRARSLGLCARSYPPVRDGVWEMLDLSLRPTYFGSIFGGIIATLVGMAALTFALWCFFAPGLDSDFRGGAGVNATWIGLVIFIFGLVFFFDGLRKRRLANRGVLAFGRVLTATSRMVKNKNSTTHYQDLLVDLLLDQTIHRIETTAQRNETVRLGVYPALAVVGEEENATLRLAPLRG